MANKTNFKIYVTCIKEASIISSRLGDKTLLATVRSKGNAYVVAKALAVAYDSEHWTMTIE